MPKCSLNLFSDKHGGKVSLTHFKIPYTVSHEGVFPCTVCVGARGAAEATEQIKGLMFVWGPKSLLLGGAAKHTPHHWDHKFDSTFVWWCLSQCSRCYLEVDKHSSLQLVHDHFKQSQMRSGVPRLPGFRKSTPGTKCSAVGKQVRYLCVWTRPLWYMSRSCKHFF